MLAYGRGLEGSLPAGSRAPRVPPEFVFSGCQESSRGTLGCCWLRVARSGEAVLLDSGRAGRSSPYRFALMIFLKERDSCEQTGLTGTAFLHTPQGISFCLRLTSKSVIGPCQWRDKQDLGCLLGRVLAAHPSGLFAARGARKAKQWQPPSGTETGTRSKEDRISMKEGNEMRWEEMAQATSAASGPGTHSELLAFCRLERDFINPVPGSPARLQRTPISWGLPSESQGPGAIWNQSGTLFSVFQFLSSPEASATQTHRVPLSSLTSLWNQPGTLMGLCARASSSG